jgi:preprotein translocase subunit SecY
MKNLIDTIKNIWRIEELRKRILITLGLLLVYRIGSFIVLPGVNSAALASASTGGGGGLVDLLSIFTGGAFTRASIFALGVMPYISASIIMQLAGIAVPAVQKMQREESGRRKINQWTRYLTILICIFQAPGYIYTYVPEAARQVANPEFWMFTSIVILTCSTLFVMWLGERITERGLGNGISLIIMIGILARLPESFIQEFIGRTTGGGGLVVILLEVVLWLLIIAGNILLVQGTRRIPVQFAKRVQGNKQYGGVRNYIPLKVNAAGVMPIIFAQAIVLIPLYISQAFENPPQWMLQFSRYESIGYNLTLFLMVVLFTYFYTAITVNPNQLADDMKRNGGFIPGVKPGKHTASHIDDLLSRITLPGAIFLGIVAILPAFAMMAGVKQGFAQFFGGTSLLIMVGVLLDTLQQIESHLLMRHYDGLMKTGRIKGRTNAAYGMATG